jgi:hypothetical protein
MAMDHTNPPPHQADQHRTLRIVAICSFIPALALLLPCGIISALPLPVVGIAPMFFSSAFNAITINGKPRLPKTTLFVHLFIASFLISILVPRLVLPLHVTAIDIAKDLFTVGYSWQRVSCRTAAVPA